MAARFAPDAWTYILGIFGLGNIANGAWMLVDPAGWYTNLPAAVPDFGPLNEHFVRDIGGAYVMVGIGLCWAAFDLRVRVPAVGLVTVFYALHALGHVYDTASGRVGPEHWLIDALPIYLPVVVLVVMLRLLVRQPPERT
jgi:hypothetical protein